VRPMVFKFLLVHGGEFLLRLLSKPGDGDGGPVYRGLVVNGSRVRRRWPTAADSGVQRP
jgi:hypothetical protein